MFIVLIGPDGVGKTSLALELNKVFKNVLYFHFIPTTNNLNNVYSFNKRLIAEKKRFDSFFSLLRIIYKIFQVNILYFFRIYPFKNRVTIGDRYIYGYYIQPSSVKYFFSEQIAKIIVTKLIKQPDFVFCLNLLPEEIIKRKNELTINQIKNEYLKIEELNLKNLYYLDATQSIEKLANIVKDKIENKNN